MKTKFQVFLQSLRKEKNYNLEDLAKILDMKVSQIKDYENGTKQPDAIILNKLAKEFDLSILELTQGKRMSTEEIENETNKMIIQSFYQQHHQTKMFTQFLIFAIICPICLYILCSIPINISIFVYSYISLLYPFLFIFGLVNVSNHCEIIKITFGGFV